MKFGAFAPSYNSEKFIVPFLKMLTRFVDRVVILQGSEPWEDYARQFDYGSGPDKSEELARTFEKVEVYPACQNYSDYNLYNQGVDLLSDCDYILRLDTDMFLSPKDFKRLLKFIEENPYDCYRVNFNKCSVEYQDSKPLYGVAVENDPIAIKGGHHFHNYLDAEGSRYIINWPDFKLHHFRGEKLSTKPFNPPKELKEYFK